MNVRLGINPLTWSNDDMPALGAEIPLETCLREARTAGYEGVELGHKFPRDAAELKPILAAHGLALVSGWYSARLLERDVDSEFAAMQPHLELLLALGCEVMVVAEVTGNIHGDRGARLSQRPYMPRGRWEDYGARLTELAERMRGRGMRMAFHHHMGTVVQSAQDIDTLMTCSGPAVELLLDTGHLTFAGADPIEFARRYANRIAHVHCKDLRADVLDSGAQSRHQLSRCRARRRVHGAQATASSTTAPCSRRWPRPAIEDGSWSRRSRTLRSHTRSPTRRSASAACPPPRARTLHDAASAVA